MSYKIRNRRTGLFFRGYRGYTATRVPDGEIGKQYATVGGAKIGLRTLAEDRTEREVIAYQIVEVEERIVRVVLSGL